MKKIDQLTSLRFFAAIYVVLYHFLDYTKPEFLKYTNFFSNGEVAVDFFFVLSGFILSHVYFQDFARPGWQAIGQFWTRRLSRIYPAHLAMLTVFVLYFGLAQWLHLPANSPERYTPETLVSNLLLIHAWGGDSTLSWNYPSWSISAEWFAYLCFPGLCLLLGGTLRRRPGVALVATLALLAVLDGLFGVTHRTVNAGILRVAPEFLAGMCLWQLRDRWRWGRQDVWLGLAILAFLAAAHSLTTRLVLVGLGMAILYFAQGAGGRIGRFLQRRPWVYLGEISYSIYMAHAFLLSVGINLVRKAPPRWDLVAHPGYLVLPFLALVLAGGAVLFHLVEDPARQLLVRRRPAPAGLMRTPVMPAPAMSGPAIPVPVAPIGDGMSGLGDAQGGDHGGIGVQRSLLSRQEQPEIADRLP